MSVEVPDTPAAIARAISRANTVDVFPTLVKIVTLAGQKGLLNPTPTQRLLLQSFDESRWTYVVKYRQAASSTVHIADQLRYVQYHEGQSGLLIGDKEDTYKELLRRMVVMYASLPSFLQIPLARPPSSESIAFNETHGGFIQGITGGGENPAIGFSPDYAVLSEYGEYQNYELFNPAFFPSIERRPHAACRIETTPGKYGTLAHGMWNDALDPSKASRWLPVFLAWWRDEYCISPIPMPEDFELSPEEADYKARIDAFDKLNCRTRPKWWRYKDPKPISLVHMWFRRLTLNTTYRGNTKMFDSKFPPDPFSGWLVGQSPTLPPEPIEEMLREAEDVVYGEEVWYETRFDGKTPFVLCVDGKGYGKAGDPAAMTLFNLWTWEEAASWSGDEDPGVITARILRWQKKASAGKVGKCHVIVETNKDGVAAALQASGCPDLYWSGDQPGWYSTEMSKKAALNNLVSLMRDREIRIRTRQTLLQMQTWDGKTRSQETKGRKHHWDRVITCLIFAYAVETFGRPRRPKAPPGPPPPPPDGSMHLADFMQRFAKPAPTSSKILGEM